MTMELACLSFPPKNGRGGAAIKYAGKDLPPTGNGLPPPLQKPRNAQLGMGENP
jgi:hypothetical protein